MPQAEAKSSYNILTTSHCISPRQHCQVATFCFMRTRVTEFVFLSYTLFIIRWSPKEITQHQSLSGTIFYSFYMRIIRKGTTSNIINSNKAHCS